MMTLQLKSDENKQKSKLNFPDGLLISEKNKEKKPLSDAEQAWIDLIEHSEIMEILPSKNNNNTVSDKNKK